MSEQAQLLKRLNRAIAELEAIKVMLFPNNHEAPAHMPVSTVEKLKRNECLQCGAEIGKEQKRVRGCHESCYKRVMELIEEGEITENEAIKTGQIAAKQSGGRPRKAVEVDKYLDKRDRSLREKNRPA